MIFKNFGKLAPPRYLTVLSVYLYTPKPLSFLARSLNGKITPI
jgi:hypothetical protein